MASNKHAQIRYKVLDDCFSNFRRKFYFDDLLEKCNDALRELYGDDHTGIKTRTLRADISYIRDRAGKAGVEVDVMDDGNGHYYRYSEPDFPSLSPALEKLPILTSGKVLRWKNWKRSASRYVISYSSSMTTSFLIPYITKNHSQNGISSLSSLPTPQPLLATYENFTTLLQHNII